MANKTKTIAPAAEAAVVAATSNSTKTEPIVIETTIVAIGDDLYKPDYFYIRLSDKVPAITNQDDVTIRGERDCISMPKDYFRHQVAKANRGLKLMQEVFETRTGRKYDVEHYRELMREAKISLKITPFYAGDKRTIEATGAVYVYERDGYAYYINSWEPSEFAKDIIKAKSEMILDVVF